MRRRAARVAICVALGWGVINPANGATITNVDTHAHSVNVMTFDVTTLHAPPPGAPDAGAPKPDASAPKASGPDSPSGEGAPAGTAKKETPQTVFHLAPGDRIENICMTGCVLRLNGSPKDDYIIEGGEMVSIEDDALYFDGEIPKPKNAP